MSLRRDRDREGGSVLVLGVGLVVVVLVLVAVVVDASRLFLARRALAGLADGAAVAGAQQVDVARVYTAPTPSDDLPLSAAGVRAAVLAYVRANASRAGAGAARVVDVRVVRAGGAETVEVVLTSDVGLPLLGTIVGDGGEVTVDARADALTSVGP